jgi:hypothetical protein
MFERLEARAARAAERRATLRTAELADRLRAILPIGVSIEAGEDGVTVLGPGIARRFVLDSSLRWTIAGLLT